MRPGGESTGGARGDVHAGVVVLEQARGIGLLQPLRNGLRGMYIRKLEVSAEP